MQLRLTPEVAGKAVAVLDMNADGMDDLVVGAPHASFNDSEIEMPLASEAHFRRDVPSLGIAPEPSLCRFWGKVFIYFGSNSTGGISEHPDVTISTSSDLTGLGWVLKAGDLNGCPH